MRTFDCEAVLLDLDGVLVDSGTSIMRQWLRWGAAHGLSPALVHAETRGSRTVDTIRRLAPQLDADNEARMMEAAQIEDVHDVAACDGASAILGALPDARWAVVTSGTRALALSRLRAAGLPIPRILVCADDVRRGKPAPDGYLHAASELRVEPRACLVVEDTALGIAAGRAAGMTVIGLAAGEDQAAHIAASGPDAMVTSLTRLRPAAHSTGVRVTLSPPTGTGTG